MTREEISFAAAECFWKLERVASEEAERTTIRIATAHLRHEGTLCHLILCRFLGCGWFA